MDAFHGGLLFIIFSVVSVSAEGDFPVAPDSVQDLPRYVVFPGLDVESEEIAEWNYGFASPFNVFFGPKPYILGWMGEAPFGPTDPEGEEEYPEYPEEGIEGEEGEEGDLEGEEEVEGEEEGVPPDYDYEKI